MKTVKVLVVDDASFVRDLVKKGIRAHFPAFKLLEASDGRAAQAVLEKEELDLILCDWEMPNMTGEQLLQWMRGNPATAETPFVMITSRGERENVMRAVELKADNYIVKPFTAEKLVGVITKVLAKSLNMTPQALKQLAGTSSGAKGFSSDLPIAATIGPGSEPPPAPPRSERAEASVRVAGKVLAQLRFSDRTIQCLLKEIGVQRLVGVIRRDERMPRILDLAVADLETRNGDVARINCYVHTLQAREHNYESEFINITVEFIDADADKLAHLRRYMAEAAAS